MNEIEGSAPAAAPVTYFWSKEFPRLLNEAMLCGGQARKRHDKVRVVLGSLEAGDPFATLPVTNNGESRIRHCVKYDLGDGWRLVTRQDGKTCTFLYMGDHEDTDRWLDNHRGEDIGVKDRRLVRMPGASPEQTIPQDRRASQHDTSLVDKLEPDDADHLLASLPASLVRKLIALDGGSRPEDIDLLVRSIQDPTRADFVRVVLTLLLYGNIDGAQAHIDADRGRIVPPESLSAEEIVAVEDGDELRQIRVGSPEYEKWLSDFEKRSAWQDWFLFLHPEQEKVVNADFPGASQLSGVSGSGKTCVAVRRAMRLAGRDGAKVLLLTLNRSLAGLLRQLVNSACVDEAVKSRITVTSFFELARALLLKFEPHNEKMYADVTWKLAEHVDEVFREYYRQWANNHDASVLFPLQKSFNARRVGGETYVRDEFDWIRSAVHPHERGRYLDLDRKGRKFAIPRERRIDLLGGLERWERKMKAIGVIDYLGLTSALTDHLDAIAPEYTHVLVDEAQDFGTTELQVVRRLVQPGANDIFLCGDIAQTILPKHRSLAGAGFSGVTQQRIRQNYRNSREILAAAYELLKNNLHEEMFESDDLEILDPRFANFSGPVPVALAADTLAEEIAYARAYADTCLSGHARTVCIAFAGFSSRDVKGFADLCDVTALDGAYDPSTDRLVFSDLEQTKGYEFDTLIIVGCCDGVLPAHDAPPEEAFRDTCKLYVAMTRAKRELVLSFHGAASPWIRAVSSAIAADSWSSSETLKAEYLRGSPRVLPEIDPNTDAEDTGILAGRAFLYTSRALGLSLEAQEKLVELVDGRGARAAGGNRRTRWPNIRSLAADLRESGRYDGVFGPKVAEELRSSLPS